MVYAIIYPEDKPIEERLPFFSKLNMVHSNKELTKWGFNVEKLQIRDVSS